MRARNQLPPEVISLMHSAFLCEFATVSKEGVPIDTPVGCFFDPGGTINVTTGLAYPAKAERARNNSKVGLLLEGCSDEPVALIAGAAAVRDSDIQANVDRYIPEIAAYFESFSGGHPWETACEGVHYWARIIIEVTPKHIWWWPNPAATDQTPHRWDAQEAARLSPSDPAPTGLLSPAPKWSDTPWARQAEEMLRLGFPAHLTLLDDDGYPLPFRVRSIEQRAFGFALALPAGAPWRTGGAASLCFQGRATFIGRVTPKKDSADFAVERTLPVLPFVQDLGEVWAPSAGTKDKLLTRLDNELARRGQRRPAIPRSLPSPTPGSLLRAERTLRLGGELASKGADQGGAPFVPGHSPTR